MSSRRWRLPLDRGVRLRGVHAGDSQCLARLLPGRSAAGGQRPCARCRQSGHIEGSNGYDFAEQTFIKPGDLRPIPAVNVNTIDEVPDSSWFTNRIGRRDMSVDEIARGPNTLETPNIDDWPVVEGKSSGITPGYRVVAPDGRLYQVKFDPPGNPEMASGAEVIGAAFYHAIGYNVVQGYIVDVDPARIIIAPNATTVDMRGRKFRSRAPTSIGCCVLPRSYPMANTARRSAASPTESRSDTSSTTEHVLTTRMTSTRTSTGVSFVATVSSRRG